tara:strand:+ start:2906 stop:9487 length:6582 start_codon:yes stop_codon:yes gene_type:complete
MPELKRNFVKGRMNLDLDERLVIDGEYRKAMNIEVSTSEGSNVGTVQSVLGNNMASANIVPDGGSVVGYALDERANKIYYLVSGNNKDIIAEYSTSASSIPVLVDVYNVEVKTAVNPITNVGANSFDLTGNNFNANIRDGMYLEVDYVFPASVPFWGGAHIFLSETEGFYNANVSWAPIQYFGPVQVYNVEYASPNTAPFTTEHKVFIRTETGLDFPAAILPDIPDIAFKSNRILDFKPLNFITGINVVDDMLFWTDNKSEPKKININRSKQGIWDSWNGHSKFYVYNADGTLVSNKYMVQEEATVAKRSPLTPPSLEMYNDISGRGTIFGVTGDVNFSSQQLVDPGDPNSGTTNIPFETGALVDVPGSWGSNPGDPEFQIGDVLILSTDPDLIANPRVFEDSEIRVVVVGVTNTNLTVKILSFKKGFFPFTTGGEEWAICLEQSKALFEFKFPRFAYRYKYQDGEYSCFSPFSDVAFVPGNFNYDSKNAYNLGMVNQLRFLKILDFVPDGLPKGVIEIDILYKESNSPNVYTVKTIKYGDPEWETWGHVTPQAPWTGQTKGAIQLESEVIYAAVASNQLLRPWDNVPRRAKAQELSASRIIYGNYVEGYNLGSSDNINLLTYIKSRDLSNELTEYIPIGQGYPSIKSLRTYQVGIVYKDKLGRETPVFTNEKASFNIAKSLADDYNSLSVQNNSNVPSWVHSYKFFIKETSNEYYNVALDRWYNAEDGGVWLSFPSAERNKIDEETYLILKKQHDTDAFVGEEARYKVIAIENEAPDYIKLQRTTLNTQTHASNQITAATTNVTGTADMNKVTAGKSGLVIRMFNASASTKWYPIKSVNESTAGSPIITLNGTFEVDVSSEIFGQTSGFGGISWEVAEEVYHNKPEFQGRFFVKIAEDGTLLANIDTSPATADTFTVKQSTKQYYIKSFGLDNSWARKKQWGKNKEPGSWRKVIGEGFFIDHANRNWGSVPNGPGPWAEDNGLGVSGARGGARKNHIEISLSAIKDNTEEGFSMASHSKPQRDFYNSLHTVNKWIRWKEDPNGVIYEITRSIGQGDSDYDHGSGIYNFDGGKGNERTWEANKTKRLYITLKATGWRKDGAGGAYKQDLSIRGKEPTWISNDIDANKDTNVAAWVASTPSTGWRPTHNDNASAGTYTSIEQPSRNGTNPNYSSPSSANNNTSGTNVTGGMNCNVQTGANFFNTIEVVEKYDADAIKEMSDNPAIFETEPKEDIGLDIYYEMDQAFPAKISGETNENFAKIGSTIQTEFPDAFIETWKDVGLTVNWTADVVSGSNVITVSNPNLHKYDLIGALISSDGLVYSPLYSTTTPPNTLIPSYFPEFALDPLGNPTTTPVKVFVESIDGDQVTLSQAATATGLSLPIVFTKRSLPKIKSWDDNVLTLDCKVVGNYVNDNVTGFHGAKARNFRLPIGMGLENDALVFNRLDGGTITGGILDRTVTSVFDGVELNPAYFLSLRMRRNSSNAKINLNWYNCYSFGNGVESDRSRDDYNAVRLGKGVKASTTLAVKYQEERKCSSLIYSGLFNNTSGVNNTNQFIQAEKITKDLNPRHGCIQKLHAREGDLITLCEDKVFKILANKDALFNADGNPQLISTNNVLGQATPLGGEYGISKNPESFAFQAYNAYFSDRSRGVILKLDNQGLVPISDHGMKDYFADNLINASKIIGSYDDKKDSYNVTLMNVNETISYGAKTNGWTSFKSFIQEGGVSLNNRYYTFKHGNIWQHHQGPTARFYGGRVNPFVTVLFNESPGSVKSFGSLNYEGSLARITENPTDADYKNNVSVNGWYVSEGETNLQQTSVLEFKNKEGKFFSRMKGEAYSPLNIDLSEFSFQGIDIASSIVEVTGIPGCTDATALNYDPNATSDCSGVIGGNNRECCCYDYGCTDSRVGYFPYNPDPATGIGLDRFQNPCGTPCVDANSQPIGFAASNFDYKFDCCSPENPNPSLETGGNYTSCCHYPAILFGCTDPTAVNYYAAAVLDDGSCCYAGCTDPLASNYNANACDDDGSCTYGGSYVLSVGDLGDQDEGGYTITGSPNSSSWTVGTYLANQVTADWAWLFIQPASGQTIQAAEFTISGATKINSFPPTYTGGSLPQEVAFVKFEDSFNSYCDGYSGSACQNGTNAQYDSSGNFVPPSTNVVLAVVGLNPLQMPSNDLHIEIDIDRDTSIPSSPVVNAINI